MSREGAGWLCPMCARRMVVTDSRRMIRNNAVRRRRRCLCGYRETTVELPVEPGMHAHVAVDPGGVVAISRQEHNLWGGIR